MFHKSNVLPQPHKIILDTDPGIDDAMAILFAEAHPNLDLKALTIVYGNATLDDGIQNALFIKNKFNCQFEVVAGASVPLKRPAVGATVAVHGPHGLGDVVAPPQTVAIDERPAYQYIIDTIHAHPGEITLVAVGPLTNLALALQMDASICSLVKQVVIMGGAFGEHGHRGNVTPYAEANIHDDPHAADIVLSAPWPVVVIGLDVTQQSFFSSDYLDALRDDALLTQSADACQFIHDVSRYYLRFYADKLGLAGCHVHDPSAIAYVLQPELFSLRQGPICVVTEGPAIGMTLQKFDGKRYPMDDWESAANQQVGVEVDASALLELYRTTLLAYMPKC
ncbi:nucleoside hydrolase [Shewanella sp. SNU WT4]|uniref:nucleoside hydrolase n=1 Tax=Shewanella sp. SNU WT4 TaxID=2590015 RepID=UPI001126147D|nr:nucleoside hydrolase [Shewanella sp. SNU WT4]QDF67863.1 nucleoside hydrolase [Shewanella sp. SNU WT4]